MKSWWQKLSDSKVSTWQAFAINATLTLAFGPFVVFRFNEHQAQVGRIAFILGLLLGGLFLLSARYTYLGRKNVGQAPWLSLMTIVASSTATVVTIRLVVSSILKLETREDYIQLALHAILTMTIWQIILAVLGSETASFRRDASALRAEILRGQTLEKQSMEHLEKLRFTVASEITSSLNRAFEALTNKTNTHNTSLLLRSLIEEVVKPLSQKLEGRDPEFKTFQGVQNPEVLSKKIIFSRLIRAVANLQPFDVRFAPILVTLMTPFTRYWATNQAAPFAFLLLCWIDMTVLMGLGILLHKKLKPRVTELNWLWVVAVVNLLIALCDALITLWVFGALVPQHIAGLAVANVVGLALIAFIRGINLEHIATLSKLKMAAENVLWMNARVTQLIWLENKRLVSMVHGEIQSRIMATSLKFSLQTPTQVDARKELLLLKKNCEQALLEPVQGGTLGQFIDSLTMLWSDSVTIENTITSAAMQKIEGDEVMVDAISELIRESVTNAVKHGNASRLWLTAELAEGHQSNAPSQQILHLSIRDNGKSTDSLLSRKPGQGTRLFDQISLDWNLGRTADGATLEIRIPMRNVD